MAQTKRYVTETGSGTGTGNWGNASNDLQDMINQSAAGDTVCVAAGTYKPIYRADSCYSTPANSTPNDSNNAFVLKADVVVLGGYNPFTGNRDWNANITILSGDIGTSNDMSDNCFHVVIVAGNLGNAVLDGFRITKGNARYIDNMNSYVVVIVNGNDISSTSGGGIYIWNSFINLRNLIIENNSAYGYGGGGIYVAYGMLNILDSVKIANNTANYGGGIFVHGTLINISNSTKIIGNTASLGGGICASGISSGGNANK